MTDEPKERNSRRWLTAGSNVSLEKLYAVLLYFLLRVGDGWLNRWWERFRKLVTR